MAKKIGVIIDFLNDKYERQLNAAAAKYGYEIEYFPSSAEAVGRVDDCEILYGHCSQQGRPQREKPQVVLLPAGRAWTTSATRACTRIPTAGSPTPPAPTAPPSPSISSWSA